MRRSILVAASLAIQASALVMSALNALTVTDPKAALTSKLMASALAGSMTVLMWITRRLP